MNFKKFNNNLLLSILTAILLSLPYLHFPLKFSILALIAFVPYFFLMDNILCSERKKKSISFFAYSFFTFFIWNAVTTWWISYATVVGAIAAIFCYSLFMATTMQISFYIAKLQSSKFISYLAIIANWISFEYIFMNSDIAWPWLVLGNSFARSSNFIQWYEFVGHLGGSAWILIVNIIIFDLLKNIRQNAKKGKIILNSAFLVVFLVVPITYSLIRYYNYQEEGYDVDVVVVQPNIDPYGDKFDNMSVAEQIDIILKLAESKADTTVDYFVAPETAIPNYMWESEFNYEPSIIAFREFLRKYPQAKFITGASTRTYYPNGYKKTTTARKFRDSNDFYDIHNTSLQIDTSLQIASYHKSKLVPGAEIMPFPKLLSFLQDIFFDLGGITGTNAGQDYREVFENIRDTTKVAVPICYESVFGDFIRQFSNNGANFIAIITNDGWWSDTEGYKQHNSYACLRAIECRKSIARSANTGISSFINQRGDIVEQTQWDEKTAIRFKIKANNKITFYAKNGDFIAKATTVISIFILIFTFIIFLNKKIKFRKNRIKN